MTPGSLSCATGSEARASQVSTRAGAGSVQAACRPELNACRYNAARSERVGQAGPRVRRQARPFHARVADGVLQPSRRGRTGHGPEQRLACGRVELQALAGGADQLRAVAVSQRPGEERLGLIAPGHPPADLKRAPLVLPAADRVDADI